LASTHLTLAQLDTAFWRQTMIALGYDPALYENTNNPPASMPVRVWYQQQGAPAWKITEDVAFVHAMEVDDPFNHLRQTEYDKASDDAATKMVTRTRVIQVSWVFYGPNSFESAFTVQNALYESFKEPLRALNLYLIPDIAAPRHVHENYAGQWWKRVDMVVRFNEKVTVESAAPYLDSATIIIKKEDGEERNVIIS
jgi:hypothetical protein